MNVVIDEAEEVYQKEGKDRRSIGTLLVCFGTGIQLEE
jgi:hypothetical protein